MLTKEQLLKPYRNSVVIMLLAYIFIVLLLLAILMT